jgi:biotin carboxyl carrier protein
VKVVYRRPGGGTHEVSVEVKAPFTAFAESGEVRGEFRVVPLGPGRFRMSQAERSWRVCVDRDGAFRHVTIEGEGEARFEREASGLRRRPDAGAGGLAAPMPGTVVRVLVSPGDAVAKGQDLLIVEAMKMEFKISAPSDGTVVTVAAVEGDPCDAGQILAEIEGAEDAE